MNDLKDRILDDLAPVAEFAAAVDKSVRTIKRLKVPMTYIGRDVYVIVSKARAMFMGEAPVKPARGRPRKMG